MPQKNRLDSKVFSWEMDATGDQTVRLKDFRGHNLVLYFYPKDDTPGCTVEGQDFSKLYKKFQTAGVEVFGISMDSLASHERFKAKYKYKIDLISDSDGKLCRAFHVIKEKNLYGKKYKGIERSTFVLDGKQKTGERMEKSKSARSCRGSIKLC